MKLTRKQQFYIEYLCNNPILSDAQIAAACDISPKQICQWKKNLEFRAEITKELDKRWADARATAQEKLFDLLECGKPEIEYKAAEFLLKTNGVTPKEAVELESDKGISIKVDIKDAD